MKFSILATLAPLVATATCAVIPRQAQDGNGLATFSLGAPPSKPALGSVSWLGQGNQAIGGPLGWWTSTHTDFKAFIQYNAAEGIAFDSTKTSRTIYLKPEGTDGLSEVVLGAPRLEGNPSAMRETNFTIDATMINPGEPRYWFGYLHDSAAAWTACPNDDGWKLYFGQATGDRKAECTESFSLEVLYTIPA